MIDLEFQVGVQEKLNEYFNKIMEIAVKYGGTAFMYHDTIEVSIPQKHKEAVMKELFELAKDMEVNL